MAGARRAKRAASNGTPSSCASRLAPSEHDSRSRPLGSQGRLELSSASEVLINAPRSAHKYSAQRGGVGERCSGFTPMGYRTRAPCFTCKQTVHKSRLGRMRERSGIFRARNMLAGSCMRPSARELKSPIGPIGTSIRAAYGVSEHRDKGSEPTASRQPARCYRRLPEASGTRQEGARLRETPGFDPDRRRTFVGRMGLPASGARFTPEGCHTEQKRYGAASAGAIHPAVLEMVLSNATTTELRPSSRLFHP
jgi:hypothetical protein